MSATVLVVENPLQGLLLRRQLVSTAPTRALANIQVKNFEELIADLSVKYLDSEAGLPSEAILDACSYSVMVANRDFGFGSAISLATAQGISQVFKTLRFTSNSKLESLIHSATINGTQRAVVKAVLDVRNLLEKRYLIPNFPNAIDQLVVALKRSPIAESQYLVFSNSIPEKVEDVLTALPNTVHFSLDYSRDSGKIQSADKYITAPDPQVEATLAVSQVLDLVKLGVHPFDIAVVYSNKQQYARLLATALDEAEIGWHGAADTVAQSSRIYRGFDLILRMLEQRDDTTSGVTRPLLMRLLESGNFSVNNLVVDADLCRKFVRDKGIYGDAIEWLKILNTIVSPDNSRDLKAVDELKALLKVLQSCLHNLNSATTWAEFGNELYSTVENFFIIGNQANLSEDELEVIRRLREVLLQEFPALDSAIDENNKGLLPSASTARAFLARKVGDRNRRNGSLASGVHLSGIDEVQILKFERVILVGATDGLLPPTSSESSFLSDSMLEELGELGKAGIATLEKAGLQGAMLSAVLADAKPIIIRPRSGMIGKLDDLPSRFLDLTREPFNTEIRIKSFEDVFNPEHKLPLANLKYFAAFDSEGNQQKENQSRTLRALRIFRKPGYDGYFGDISGAVHPLTTVDTYLSASAIETFIDCQYRFFVTKRLGIYTGERRDELDTWRPNDFGNLIHTSMENFLKDLSDQNELPDGNSSFSESQIDIFFDVHLAKALQDFYAKGHDVWRSGFENHMNRVKKNLRHFFKEEFTLLRAHTELAVYGSEVPFGKGTGTPVPVMSSSGIELQLTGRIDRIDLSGDRSSAGVLDFKSGKFDKTKVERELGKPASRGPNKDNSIRKKVQDLVYTLAIKEMYPQVKNVDVNFAYISNGEQTQIANAAWADYPEVQLASIVEGIVQADLRGKYYVSHTSSIGFHTYCDICSRLGWVAEQLRIEYLSNEVHPEEAQDD